MNHLATIDSDLTGQTPEFLAPDTAWADTAAPSPCEAVQRVLLAELSVQLLIEQAKTGRLWRQGYAETTRLLEAVPLAAAEFDLAKRRLRNAVVYSQKGEFGAASFELRMLRRCLEKL
jgi:hypothetical protein